MCSSEICGSVNREEHTGPAPATVQLLTDARDVHLFVSILTHLQRFFKDLVTLDPVVVE